MSSTMSAIVLKMAARMYRVIGRLGCNFDSGGHIRDGNIVASKDLVQDLP